MLYRRKLQQSFRELNGTIRRYAHRLQIFVPGCWLANATAALQVFNTASGVLTGAGTSALKAFLPGKRMPRSLVNVAIKRHDNKRVSDHGSSSAAALTDPVRGVPHDES